MDGFANYLSVTALSVGRLSGQIAVSSSLQGERRGRLQGIGAGRGGELCAGGGVSAQAVQGCPRTSLGMLLGDSY